LTVFLIIFAIALIYQIDIITSTTEVTKKDLQIEPMTDNYKSLQVDFSAKQFKIDKLFLDDSLWKPSKARNKEDRDKYFTDLLLPFEMVRCPHCQKIMPRWLLFNPPHECLACHGELKRPANAVDVPVIKIDPSKVTATTDSDNGGIPDLVEQKYGLKPAVASDDSEDMDGDGFANVYEYQQKTKMNDPKSHPPLYLRLYLDKLVKNKLNFVLKNVVIQGKDKSAWTIQINFGESKTGFFWLGDEITVDNRKYTIIDVTAKNTKVKNGNIENIIVSGNIKVKSADGKEIVTAVIGKEVFSPNPRAIIIDEGTGRKYSMNIGDVIEMGNKKTGIKRYQVTAIDSMKGEESVTIEDMVDKKTYKIDSTLKIPKVIKEQNNFDDDEINLEDKDQAVRPGGMDMPPEMMVPSARSRRSSRRSSRRGSSRRRSSRRGRRSRRNSGPQF